LGKIPNPDALVYKYCGSSVLGQNESCDTALSGQDNIVKLDPVVYGYSNETAALLQRVALTAKIVFVLAVPFLFWALSLQLPAWLAAAGVAFVCWNTRLTLLAAGTIYSEILFPALAFFYIACIIVYVTRFRALWLLLASVACVACFFVKPAFLYLVVFHVAF